eukprot:350789-Chlamydomonas_euryale.AAC.4
MQCPSPPGQRAAADRCSALVESSRRGARPVHRGLYEDGDEDGSDDFDDVGNAAADDDCGRRTHMASARGHITAARPSQFS